MQYNLPTITLKGLITLPDQEIKLEINNTYSKKTIDIAKKEYDNKLLVICPANQKEEEPDVSDLPKVGVVSSVSSSLVLPNGNLRVVLKGIKRVATVKYFNLNKSRDILISKVEDIELPKLSQVENEACRRKLVTLLKKYIKVNPNISNSVLSSIVHVSSLDILTDTIASFLPLNFSKKLNLMQEINSNKRAFILINHLTSELEIIDLENKIDEELQHELDNSQKEFILKEKLKLIKEELGEREGKELEIDNIISSINKDNFPDYIYNKIINELHRYEMTSEMSPESSMIRNYIDLLINLPWNSSSKENIDIKSVEKSLNKSHYGLDEIKKRILEYLFLKNKNPDINTPIICLVGPPGVGKSTFAKSISKSLNREFAKISVSGLSDSSELTGHRKTYVGSEPGKIIKAFSKTKTNNPVILIDEVDKIVKDYKGDPTSVLLDILDINQNKSFVDNYLDEPFDLSKTLFILTANYIENIPAELRDRLEIIEINSYTIFDKTNIAKKHIIPKLCNIYKVSKKKITISDKILHLIINSYTKEPGVRDLERILDNLYRKILIDLDDKLVNVSEDDILKYLGKPKYELLKLTNWKKGCMNCLACTYSGGEVLPVEAVYTNSESQITGMLGTSMNESIMVVNSYIGNNLDLFNISLEDFNKGMHIHFLDGASPKDGSSAGIATVTVMLSLLKNKVIPKNIAMTGEITLSGNILKIGSLKDKLIGAYNANIKTVYIPKSNEADLDDIPSIVKEKIDIKLVSDYIQIYNDLFN